MSHTKSFLIWGAATAVLFFGIAVYVLFFTTVFFTEINEYQVDNIEAYCAQRSEEHCVEGIRILLRVPKKITGNSKQGFKSVEGPYQLILVGETKKATSYDSVCVRGLEISKADPSPSDADAGWCGELKNTEPGFRAVVWLPGGYSIGGTGVGIVDVRMEVGLKKSGTAVFKKMAWRLSAKRLWDPWFAV